MFSRNKKPESARPTDSSPPPSLISADMRLIGDLVSQGEVQIDGSVEGDIRAKSLLIGETADVKGEILADQVRIHGRIEGQVKARSVHLADTAHVAGDILHESLSIETGAFIEGNCKRMTDQTALPAPGTDAALSPATRIAGTAAAAGAIIEGKKLFG